MDRLITIKMGHYNRDSEVMITQAKSGIQKKHAEIIVDIVREIRNIGVNNNRPTIRACIAIAKVTSYRNLKVNKREKLFRQICHDVLSLDSTNVSRDGQPMMVNAVDNSIDKIFSASQKKKNKK